MYFLRESIGEVGLMEDGKIRFYCAFLAFFLLALCHRRTKQCIHQNSLE